MKWNGYEFDEAYRPSGFEEWSQEKVNIGYAFYLRDKYVTDDTGLYEDTDEGTIHIFCPHFGETFEEDEKKVFGGKDAQYQCHCGSTMRLQASCPRERYCGHTCKLLNAVYPYYGVKKKGEFAFYQRTDRGMMLRAFTCTVTYPGERYELRRFGDAIYTEWLRVFYNADRTTEIYSRLRQSYSGNGGYFTCIEETESLTNTVTFKQAFGEQILITVTSQENAEAKDTCTVDCAAKLESTYVTFAAASGVSGDVAVELNATSGTSSAWAMFKYFDTEEIKAAQLTHNTTDVYTIEDSYTTIVTIAPSAELLAKAKEINSSAVSGSVDITSGFAPNMDFFAQLLGESFANKTNLYELGRVLDAKGVANPFVVTVTTTSTYTADVTDTYYMAYTASNFGKAVTGIHFDDDTIIF